MPEWNLCKLVCFFTCALQEVVTTGATRVGPSPSTAPVHKSIGAIQVEPGTGRTNPTHDLTGYRIIVGAPRSFATRGKLKFLCFNKSPPWKDISGLRLLGMDKELSQCQCVNMQICQSVNLGFYQFNRLSICQLVSVPTCQFVDSSICQYVN